MKKLFGLLAVAAVVAFAHGGISTPASAATVIDAAQTRTDTAGVDKAGSNTDISSRRRWHHHRHHWHRPHHWHRRHHWDGPRAYYQPYYAPPRRSYYYGW